MNVAMAEEMEKGSVTLWQVKREIQIIKRLFSARPQRLLVICSVNHGSKFDGSLLTHEQRVSS